LSQSAAAIISPPVSRYIANQQRKLQPIAVPLSVSARSEMAGYFNPADLDRVRIVVTDPLPINEPPFAGIIRRLGLDFPSVALTAAITFDSVIASREPMNSSLLFHELVHVVQYRLLGVDAFARLYVHGFLAGGSYHDIPLECCAFQLEERFVTGGQVFDVEKQVAAWIEAERFG
jgi:hypothetical protein